jgi:hypothetical protein
MGCRVKDLTGEGVTSCVSMAAADLGIMRWDDDRGAIAVMFGDNFECEGLQPRSSWQSPSIVMYDENYNVRGIPMIGDIEQQPRRQLWAYDHDNAEFSTVLPCDFIRVGAWWHVAAMVTQGLGNELRTEFWRSLNLIYWEYEFALQHNPGHPGNINLTFELMGDWVYIMGTGGLKRDRGIWLWRNPADQFPRGWWEPWGYDRGKGGWSWGTPNEATPIIGGRVGEINLRNIGNRLVLSYFDAAALKMTARIVRSATDDWLHAAHDDYMTWGRDDANHISFLYGGYISPLSRLNVPGGMKYAVSQWDTSPWAGNKPYKVILCDGTLSAP